MKVENKKSIKKNPNDTAINFVNERLFPEICKYFEEVGDSIFSNVKNVLKKIIIVENNTVYVPITDLKDTINFSIFVEGESLFKNEQVELPKMNKLSSIIENNNKDIDGSDSSTVEQTYDEDQIVECLNYITSDYQKTVDIKNDYYIITFE